MLQNQGKRHLKKDTFSRRENHCAASTFSAGVTAKDTITRSNQSFPIGENSYGFGFVICLDHNSRKLKIP